MRSRGHPSDAQLVGLLEDVGARLDDPAAPYLATRVRARLETEAAPRPAPSRWVRLVFAGVVVAVALSMVLAFSPATRRAVAGWLGLRGVEIERVDTPPPATALGGDLDLGEPVSLSEAGRRADFDLVLLPEREFGPPDELYFADAPRGGRVDAIYASKPGLPLLLTQFRGEADAPFIRKTVGDDVGVETVTVDAREGVWLEGGPHTVGFLDESGKVPDRTRLAGNTLLWERGDLTLRLESDFSKEEAVALAEDVVVTPPR